jgi:hypothetical protein
MMGSNGWQNKHLTQVGRKANVIESVLNVAI